VTRITTWKQNHEGTLIGGWGLLGAATAETMSFSGLDWIGLDAQHGSFNDGSVLEALHAIPRERVDALVRVPRNDEAWIGRVLDAGARGVIVPMVETAEDAQRAASACRYPAQGTRSWGQVGGRWGRDEIDPVTSNQEVVCSVMVESETGLRNVDAIASTPGIDMIFVGPFDLSIALGTTVHELLERGAEGQLGEIVAACQKHNVIPGAFAGTAGTDHGMLGDAARALKAADSETERTSAY
jgi:4-hydroxy-2-oxoheptanedioate aldolase